MDEIFLGFDSRAINFNYKIRWNEQNKKEFLFHQIDNYPYSVDRMVEVAPFNWTAKHAFKSGPL
jgi:hypothetical protein